MKWIKNKIKGLNVFRIAFTLLLSTYYTYFFYETVSVEELATTGVLIALITIAITLVSNLYSFKPESGENETYFTAKKCKEKLSSLKSLIAIIAWCWLLPLLYSPLKVISVMIIVMIIITLMMQIDKSLIGSVNLYDKFVEVKKEEQKRYNRNHL